MTPSLDPKQTHHLKEPQPVTAQRLITQTHHFLWADPPIYPTQYDRINAFRNWFNGNFFPRFELYLEDVWNETVEGETHFEYRLRCSRSADETELLAYDVYANHQDRNHVWHLDDYQHTVILMTTVQTLIQFMTHYQPNWETLDCTQ